jgi:Zn-dependent oligopeptidase
MTNPFFKKFETTLESVPFEEIKLEHYLPAVEKAISEAQSEVEAIKNQTEKPTFHNTIEPLERAGKMLGTVSSVFFNMNSAHTSDEMQQLAQVISPKITAYSNELMMDEALFAKVQQAHASIQSSSDLTEEQLYLANKTIKGFIRNGAQLTPDKKEILKEINTRLSKLTLTFGEHILKDNNAFELVIKDKNELVGLPEGLLEASKMLAKEKGYEDSYVFTLDYPSYIPFMQYCGNRKLREQLFIAFGTKGFLNNENNNESSIKEIVSLRLKRAQLLGYDSHADYTLEERMAINPTNVYRLWDELLTYALPKAQSELKEIAAFASELDGLEKLERWDFSYYSEKLKMKKYAFDDEVLKPYFKIENVVEGAFITAKKLFGIDFKERFDIQKYHEDVRTFEVLDKDGSHLALFYADFYPRASKRGGAWMTSFRDQNKYDGVHQRPHVAIVCNFTKPTETKPSLLTFNEVTTLFHEFGHALHGIFANGYYESLSGTNVFWDFVELPSQLMENWCYEKECLDVFARHYQTNEGIPFELIQKIKDSSNFLAAYQTVRQVSLGKLDMAWHSLNSEQQSKIDELTVSAFENEATADCSLFEAWDKTNTSTSFSHIFSGGYSAGYYSYKWAEVLEADAFELFQEKGIFNTTLGQSYRDEILSKGGRQHPMALYKAFKGSEPSSKALLKKCGLL